MNDRYSESDTDTWNELVKVGSTHPPLSAEEEKQMTDAYFSTDHQKWAEIMVTHNIRFAIVQSGRYFVRGEDRVDILGRLISGLVEATSRYDPGKGVRFLTFAGYYMKNALRDFIDATRPAVKSNNLTMAILDKRVSGKKTDDSSVTIGDFIGGSQNPDYETVDPGSELRRDFERIEFENLINHICGILEEIPVYGTAGYDPSQTNGLRLTRSGLSRMIRLFRLRFLDMLSLDAIATQENCTRITVSATINKTLDYLRKEIERNHGSVAELKDFFSRNGLDAAISPEKTVDLSESQFSPETVLSVKTDVRILDTLSDSQAVEEETSDTIAGADQKIDPTLLPEDVSPGQEIEEDPENQRPIRVIQDDGGIGYTVDMFERDQKEESERPPNLNFGPAKTVYRDSGFLDGDDAVQDCRYSARTVSPRGVPGVGFDVKRARTTSNEIAMSLYGDTPWHVGGDVTPNYNWIKIHRSLRRKLTMHCYPFYGHFYSEWRRWQEINRIRNLHGGKSESDETVS